MALKNDVHEEKKNSFNHASDNGKIVKSIWYNAVIRNMISGVYGWKRITGLVEERYEGECNYFLITTLTQYQNIIDFKFLTALLLSLVLYFVLHL